MAPRSADVPNRSRMRVQATLTTSKRAIAVVSVAGMAVPLVMGFLPAPWFHVQLAEPRPPLFGFRQFLAIAMSITAIPILGRIFIELRLSRTRTAARAAHAGHAVLARPAVPPSAAT